MSPVHDTPILGMATRPRVEEPLQYGGRASFWVEYPSGLLDLSRSKHLESKDASPPDLSSDQLDMTVDGDRTIRVKRDATAAVIIDMQNFFLHPDLRNHETGLACVDPLMKVVPHLRTKGVKILWVNWGLTDKELLNLPPALIRGFMKKNRGLGSELPVQGRVLMRGEENSNLYGPLQKLYEEGKAAGTDEWIHKNRMSALWGHQNALDLYLKENGITTLLLGGVNTDQCVGGTLIDGYYLGYDCVLVTDATGTTSPKGGYENFVYNAANSYGFTTNTKRLLKC